MMSENAGLPPEIEIVVEKAAFEENKRDRNSDGIISTSGGNKNRGDTEEIIPSVDTTDKRTLRIVRQQHYFAAKKTVAQGMMDVALITANANQLRYLVEYQRHSPTFWIIVFLIIISLVLQIAVGVSLIFKGRFDLKGRSKSPQARKINNYVVVGIFLITIINVFVAAFSVTSPSTLGLTLPNNSF